jgi:hypothetical protein
MSACFCRFAVEAAFWLDPPHPASDSDTARPTAASAGHFMLSPFVTIFTFSRPLV